jgi:hypothetical protein
VSDDHRQEAPRDRVNFGAPRGGTALGGLQWRQLGLFVAAGLWALVWTRSLAGPAGPIVGALGAAGLATAGLLRAGGRLPVDWGAIGTSFAIRRVRGRTRYRHPRVRSGDRLPAHLYGIRILEIDTDQGVVGLVRDGARLIAVLEVTAEPMMLAGSAEMAGRRAAWGAILVGLARPGSGITRVQWIAQVRAIGPCVRGRHVDASLRGRTSEAAVQSYLEVVDRVCDMAQECALTVALGIDARRRPGAAAAQHALDAAAELNAQLAAAELGAARILDAAEVSALVRTGGDPRCADAFEVTAHTGVLVPADAEDPGPMAVDEDWGLVRCDASWHASFWISQWPRGDVDASVLAALVLAGRCGRTVTLVMQPRDPARAVRDAEQSRLRHTADDELRERAGFVGTVRRRRQQAAISAQERELADGHAAYRFAGYVTVSAATRESLEDLCRELAASAPLARCEVRRLWGEQAAGLAATLPICRGLG